MRIEMTNSQFRLLLDMVYIGNWVLNSTRGPDRITEYDQMESLIFALCRQAGMPELAEKSEHDIVPSRPYCEGGIHEAIMDYEDTVFFNILAEELARRDLNGLDVDGDDKSSLDILIDKYSQEFECNGVDNIVVPGVNE